MPQHIGIDACSAEGAALDYRRISWMAPICSGPHNHAEISMHTHPFAEYVKCICANHWAGVAELMLSSSQKCAQAGADFLIAPANTIYQAFDVVEHRSPRPWLHIAVALAHEAKRCPYKRLGVLGTSQRMEGPVYRDTLKSTGTDHRVPGAEQRQPLNPIIFGELIKGEFLPRRLAYCIEATPGLKDQGCDALILGCTEVPLLLSPEAAPLPTLDSTCILARAALRKAVED